MEVKTSRVVSDLEDLREGNIDIFVVKDASKDTIKEFGELIKQDMMQADEVPIGYQDEAYNLSTHSDMAWHNDGSHLRSPYPFAALYCEDIDQGASPTHFCDMKQAWKSLPENIKDKVKKSKRAEFAVRNWYTRDFIWPYEFQDEKDKHTYLRFARALQHLYRNDKFGEYLYFSPAHTTTDLLEDLNKVFKDECIYTHHWESNDLVVWNNFTLSHKRDASPDDLMRKLIRYAVKII